MLTRISVGSLAHELVLPIWKSNVSVMLMLDKRAKRYVRAPVPSVVSIALIADAQTF